MGIFELMKQDMGTRAYRAHVKANRLNDTGKLTEANKAAWIEEYIEKYGIYETTGNGIMFETHPYPEREDDWDTYVSTMEMLGLDMYTEVWQSVYDRTR